MCSGFLSATTTDPRYSTGVRNWSHSRYQSRWLGCATPIWAWKIFWMQYESVVVVDANQLLNCGCQRGSRLHFSQCPALYACVRSWIGSRISVSPKQIGIYGSARIGSSLAPSKLGAPFDNDSDLDLFVVSQCYFRRLRNDYDLWSSDCRTGKVEPRSDKEHEYWTENLIRLEDAIARGFIDVWKIPNFYRYTVVQRTADSMWRLVEKLKSTAEAPTPSHASIRCYLDWPSAIERMSFNLWALRGTAPVSAPTATATATRTPAADLSRSTTMPDASSGGPPS